MSTKNLKRIFADDPEMLRSLESRDQSSLLKALVREQTLGESAIKVTKIEYLKGEPGEKGDPGDSRTEEELISIIQPLIPDPIKGDKGDKGDKGEDGKSIRGKDGKDADETVIVSKVLKQIPKVQEVKALDLANKLNSLKEAIEPSVIKGYESSDAIIKKIKNQKLEMRDIKGMPLNMNDMRWHGGGLSSVSHDGTLTGDGTPSSPLSVVGGGGTQLYGEDLTPQVPGTVFTLANVPVVGTVRLYRGGARQQEGAGNDYTIAGDVITFLNALSIGEILIADYNF